MILIRNIDDLLKEGETMKIGLVLNTNDPETIWNSLRFGITSLIDGHETTMFLLGKGVELEDSSD
jgi:uncharacterized protein involved in oxidation of intracellular sulfur